MKGTAVVTYYAIEMHLWYPLSYGDPLDLLAERCVAMNQSTGHRWVQKIGAELADRTNERRLLMSLDWQVNEIYVRVGGKWRYLWRAIDRHGQMNDFRLTARRDAKAAEPLRTTTLII